MRFQKKVWCALSIFIWACSSTVRAEIPKKLTEPQAYKLLRGLYGNLHGGFFDYSPDVDKIFYAYQGIGRPGTEGGFGFFSVNPWTGDVWALWGCYKLKMPELRAAKAEIRRRFTAAELKQYDRLSRLKPDCIVED
ncbi:hypothetical protein [Caulobacter sp. S45]|uniref:hypothetical protein n=1 Tax=Caulobacter sp. S45 TaxID=1641861 RepID=UPI00131AE183|nr:hypothetical protein [Caulobacter sp. S45]